MAAASASLVLPEGVTIDWCEDNYAVQTWVAEFWNTWTSVITSLVFMVWLVQPAPPGAGALPWLHLLFLVISVGSVAFHSTLTWVGQLLDEVPILVFVSFSLAIVVDNLSLHSGFKRTWWAPGPAVLAALCTVESAALACLYALGTKVYGVFIAGVVVQAALHWPILLYFLRQRLGWDPVAVRLLVLHVGIGYSGFGLWCLENSFCSRLKFLNLHAVWHFTSALSMKFWLDLLIYCRLRAAGQEPHYKLRALGLGACFHASPA